MISRKELYKQYNKPFEQREDIVERLRLHAIQEIEELLHRAIQQGEKYIEYTFEDPIVFDSVYAEMFDNGWDVGGFGNCTRSISGHTGIWIVV